LALQSEQEKAALRDRLREQLNVVLETRETARGLIVNLSDVLFDSGSANLKPGAREKLARISGILVTHPDLRLAIEGHTDSVGATDYNQQLSERRAVSVRTYLVDQKKLPRLASARRALVKVSPWRPTARPRGASRIGVWSSWCPATSSDDSSPFACGGWVSCGRRGSPGAATDGRRAVPRDARSPRFRSPSHSADASDIPDRPA
jgi:hypothetical protein